jgi:hypothetical protein
VQDEIRALTDALAAAVAASIQQRRQQFNRPLQTSLRSPSMAGDAAKLTGSIRPCRRN